MPGGLGELRGVRPAPAPSVLLIRPLQGLQQPPGVHKQSRPHTLVGLCLLPLLGYWEVL